MTANVFQVFFFQNGMAAVCDASGNEMPEFQGRHKETLHKLRDAGIDIGEVPEVMGKPILSEMDQIGAG